MVLVLVSIALLYRSAKSELAPQEDQGFVGGPADLGSQRDAAAKLLYAAQAYKIFKNRARHVENVFQIEAPGQSIRRPGAAARSRSAKSATR